MIILPKISIVVPNYNGGTTIGATLESLIKQGYPDLEIIVMDGGSTDNSVAVIKRYEKHLKYWQSEKDKGQSDAINRGLERATGEVVNWLCSDDLLVEGALARIGEEFEKDPLLDVLTGRARNVYLDSEGNQTGESLHSPKASDLHLLPAGCPVAQPSTFYRRRTLDRDEAIAELVVSGVKGDGEVGLDTFGREPLNSGDDPRRRDGEPARSEPEPSLVV